jgi:tRNA A-37 threonylcarbamoyl transferase component Bud32
MEAVAPNRRLAGRYVLEESIAAGGMAVVWKANDVVLARTVAVKILREDLAREGALAERFHREAVAAAALTHPHIISVFDTGTDDGLHYIVMEHFAGRSLWQVLAQEGPMEPPAATAMLLPVLEALAFAHQQGLVHRDIKPGNILVGDDGWVKVADFGIAKAAYGARDLTTTGALLGTVRYISPEQVQGLPVDGRSDLYSVAAVLYEALTGRPPFEAETDVATAMIRLTQEPTPPRAIRPGISKRLEGVILQGMARDPVDRFPSAEAMHFALDQDAAGPGPQSPDPAATRVRQPSAGRRPGGTPARRPATFRSWILVPLILLVLAAAAIATGLLEIGGPLGVRPAHQGSATEPAASAKIPITDVRDFDPQGADRSEHPDQTQLAQDGDSATAWTTDHYDTADFGRLKDGLGLWVGFGEDRNVTRVVIRSPLSGWSFQLRAGSPPDALAQPLASESGETTFKADPSGKTVVVLRPASTSGILIWITQLAPDGGRFASAIAEVSVQGSTV